MPPLSRTLTSAEHSPHVTRSYPTHPSGAQVPCVGGGGEGDGGGGGNGEGGGLSLLVAVGSQPLHAAGYSVAAIRAHASASFIRGPAGDSCSHVIRSPHEWEPAIASHTGAVHEAVPHRDPCDGDDNGSGGLGGGGSASIEK